MNDISRWIGSYFFFLRIVIETRHYTNDTYLSLHPSQLIYWNYDPIIRNLEKVYEVRKHKSSAAQTIYGRKVVFIFQIMVLSEIKGIDWYSINLSTYVWYTGLKILQVLFLKTTTVSESTQRNTKHIEYLTGISPAGLSFFFSKVPYNFSILYCSFPIVFNHLDLLHILF